MNCPSCSKELIVGGQHTYEDYGMDSDGVVTNFICDTNNCNTDQVLVYSRQKNKSKRKKRSK